MVVVVEVVLLSQRDLNLNDGYFVLIDNSIHHPFEAKRKKENSSSLSPNIPIDITRFADGIDRDVDGDSLLIGWIGDVTVELVCVGVNITDELLAEPLPGDARLLLAYKSKC